MICKKCILLILIISTSMYTIGCWNYREIDKLAIVTGVAVDKGFEGRYRLTVEFVDFLGERESRVTSKIATSEGKTIFDAARNAITILGKRLYWAHSKVLIISEEMAQEGILKIIDWFNRDSETRADVYILVSKGQSAKDILEAPSVRNDVRSFEMREILDNERSLAKAPQTEIWELTNALEAKGTVATAPVVESKHVNGSRVFRVMGTAIFKKDKLVSYIDEEETKAMLFIKDEVRGGVLVRIESETTGDIPISLEIFKSNTKVDSIANNDTVGFNVDINTTVAINELGGSKNFIDDVNRKELERLTAKEMEARIMRLINNMQYSYGTDIFGFGEKLRENKPKAWEKYEGKWESKFPEAKINVSMKIHIRNSAMMSKPLEAGE